MRSSLPQILSVSTLAAGAGLAVTFVTPVSQASPLFFAEAAEAGPATPPVDR